jgi:hypothetical protein
MKKALLYLLLFSYSIIVLKPMLPAVADTFAHIFWYSEHMATVHYEHGKYHVHLENINAARKDAPEKHNSLRADEPVNVHLQITEVFNFTAFAAAPNTFITTTTALADSFPNSHYPPPRQA